MYGLKWEHSQAQLNFTRSYKKKNVNKIAFALMYRKKSYPGLLKRKASMLKLIPDQR